MSDGDIYAIDETVLDGKPLGRHVHHDPRSRDFTAPVYGLATQTKVWHRHVSVFDQGNLGSCTGNAVTGCCATEPTWVKGKTYSESTAIKVYEKATTLDAFQGQYPPDDTGSTGLAACKAAVYYKLASKYLWGFGINDMIGILSNMGPCAVGVDWYEGFDNPNTEGLVYIAGQIRGGHEFQVIGWHQDTSLGAPESHVFEAQNSWGKSWGVRGTPGTYSSTRGSGGRFYIRLADMDRLLKAGGDCVTLVTDVKPQ